MIIACAGDAFCVGLDLNDVRELGQTEKSGLEKAETVQAHPIRRIYVSFFVLNW